MGRGARVGAGGVMRWSSRFLAAALLGVCCPGVACRPSPDTAAGRRPDVVVITLDTTRADHLGLYGYFRDTSPVLDALGAESLVFERHIVSIATTLPSHTSLFTGTDPLEHGVLANLKAGGTRLTPSPSLRTFAEYLRANGYRTGAFVGATPLKRGCGLEQGFETFDQPLGAERHAEETNDQALAWMGSIPLHEPMLLWVHYFDPHGPYQPPAPLDRMFATDAALERHLAETDASPLTHRRSGGRAVETRDAVNGYDGEIRYMDQQIGRLLDGLRQRGRWDSAVILVFGDHGESLGQHGEAGHGQIWGEQLHAPLLMRIPGIAPARVATVISTVDVLPTLLARLDLPGAAEWLQQSSGSDVLAPTASLRPALSRSSLRRESLGEREEVALTGRHWKLVRDEAGNQRLYDLERDPYELHPLDAGPAAVRRQLTSELAARLVEIESRASALRPGTSESLPREILEQLEQLGYVADDPAD